MFEGFFWFDLWVGAYYNQAKRKLYVCPLPCVVFSIQFQDEIWIPSEEEAEEDRLRGESEAQSEAEAREEEQDRGHWPTGPEGERE